ncbi:MAG: glutamate synthase [Halomonadaceae bacterium]|nr:MAG: glutamate synthase [Halomonadaceae bacterium]
MAQPVINSLHIASVLVHVQPTQLAATIAWLQQHRGCEVRGQDPGGKIVVVLESHQSQGGEHRILDLIAEAQARTGVVSAALVYHQQLDPDTADEPQPGAVNTTATADN